MTSLNRARRGHLPAARRPCGPTACARVFFDEDASQFSAAVITR